MNEKLTIRFTKAQRAKIRKGAKRFKISEAEFVRRCVDSPIYSITNR